MGHGGRLHGADGHRQPGGDSAALRVAIKLARDYNDQLKLGKVPTFDANKYPEIRSQLEEGIWDNPAQNSKQA